MAILGVPSSKEDLLARQAATPMSFAEFVEVTPRHLTLQPALRTLQPAPWQLKLAFHKLFIALQREATKATKATPRETALLFASPFRGGSHRQFLGEGMPSITSDFESAISSRAQLRLGTQRTILRYRVASEERPRVTCRNFSLGSTAMSTWTQSCAWLQLESFRSLLLCHIIMPCPLVMDRLSFVDSARGVQPRP